MLSLSRFALVSALFCSQSLLACGGSTDSHGSPDEGESAGSSSHSAGAGPHSAGAPAAGSGNSGGAGSTGSGTGSAGSASTPAPNGTKLSAIETDAQALAICNQIKDTIADADLKKMLAGSCAISALTGAASQLGTCEDLQKECTEHSPLPSTNDGSCTADDIPDCDNVTVEEYIACTRGSMARAIEYLSAISCETDLESLEAPGTASACVAPFARCPEYAAEYQ